MEPNPIPVVTVDGPNASGKGTVCQLLAEELGFHLLDSGALYRLVAIVAQDANTPLDDTSSLTRHAQSLDVHFQPTATGLKITLAGDNVSERIRTEGTGNQASIIAAQAPVRDALLLRQRAFRRPPGLIADGRDMGTVIFPDAIVKIFLTASSEVRALRRYNQLKEKGIESNISSLMAEIEARDLRDRKRSVAPLFPAQDALTIDTSTLSPGEVLARISKCVSSKIRLVSRI